MMVPAGYDLLWSDNFRTSNLDTSKWFTRLIENGGLGQSLPSNGEQERYCETGAHVMTGSSVKLMAQPAAADGSYPSGVLRSKRLINPAGSYVAVRMMMAGYQGVDAGAWLRADADASGNTPWPPEIDLCEAVKNASGDDMTKLHCGAVVLDWTQNADGSYGPQHFNVSYHDPSFQNPSAGVEYYQMLFDLSAGFHTFAVLLEEPNYTIWCDDKKMVSGVYNWTADAGPCAWPHLIIQHAVGGNWAGRDGVDNTKLPAAVEVQSVHVYVKTPRSTIGQDLMPNGG